MFFNDDSSVIRRSIWGPSPDKCLQILDQVDALRSHSCRLGCAMSELHRLHRDNSDRLRDLMERGDRLLHTVVNANENFDAAIDYWKSRIAAIRAKIAAVKLYYHQRRLQIDRAQTCLIETMPFRRFRYIPSSRHSMTPLDINLFRPRLKPYPIPSLQRRRQTAGTSQPDPCGGKKASERDRSGCPDRHPEFRNQKMPRDIFASHKPP